MRPAITEPTTDHYKIVPATIPEEFVAVLDVHDGTYIWRFVFLKGTIGATNEIDMPRDNAVKLPIDFAILELEESEDPFVIFTNAAQMDAAVAAS